MGQLCVKDSSQDEETVERRRKSRKYAAEKAPPVTSPTSGLKALEQLREDTAMVTREFVDPHFHQYSGLFESGEAALCVQSADRLLNNVGQHLAIAGSEDRSISLFNYNTGHVVKNWDHAHRGDVTCLSAPVASGGGIFFSGSRDRQLKMWSVFGVDNDPENPGSTTKRSKGRKLGGCDDPLNVFSGHTLPVTTLDHNLDASRLFSGSRDNCVRMWDAETGVSLSVQDVKLNIVHFVKYLPEQSLLAQGGEDLTVRLWDVRTEDDSLDLAHTLANFDYHPICCAVSPRNEHTLYTGHNGFNNQGSMITEWDLRMRGQVKHFFGHGFTVRSLQILQGVDYKKMTGGSADYRPPRSGGLQNMLVSASDDETVKVWDTECTTEDPVKYHNLGSFSFPEGRVSGIAESRGEGGALLFSCRSGCVVATRPGKDVDHAVQRYRYLGVPGNR